MDVMGREARHYRDDRSCSFQGTATYIRSCTRVKLYLTEMPAPPLSASLKLGRSRWFSMRAGASSESPRTWPVAGSPSAA